MLTILLAAPFGSIVARDGFGNAVDWFSIIKLPSKFTHPSASTAQCDRDFTFV